MSSPFQKKFSAKSPVGSTPLTKKSPCYVTDDKKSGFQPNRATVELDDTTRLTRDSQIVKDRKSGEVVIGGGYDSGGKYIPRTDAQKKSATEEQLATRKAKAKKTEKKEFNKPENVAKREANKAKLDAARKAKQERDKKKG
jgi:hypothetical protein